MASTRTLEKVKEYYGSVLSGSGDLKTSACCSAEAMPAHVRDVLAQLPEEVLQRFYGCGSPIPPAIAGATVLDLGCGTGRDVFVCAKLVGPEGSVIGVDMTEAQLDVARRLADDCAARFGYERPNTTFLHGQIEDLAGLGLADDSVDVVISNCVLNLSPDKPRVFEEIFRVLRPGGELYFSDVFADRRLPAEWMDDPVLVGECLAGAMYAEDFRRSMSRMGFPDVRIVSQQPIQIEDEAIAGRLGAARFYSMTVRVFAVAGLEDGPEDYGQRARYEGTIPGAPERFVLDGDYVFERGRDTPICANTHAILAQSRLADHFVLAGDRRMHRGRFVSAVGGGMAVLGGACC